MSECRRSVQRWLEPRARRVEKDLRKKAVHCLKMKMNMTNQPKKLCQWTDKQIRHAMEAIMSVELGVNRSALQHGVPRTTKLLVEFSTIPSPDQSPTLMLKKKIRLIFCLNVQEWKKQESKQIKLQRQEAQRKKHEDRAAKQAEQQKAEKK